jgi:hypothetical protein
MFSVRATPWHGLGVVLDEYPRSIDEALDRAGLGWRVGHPDAPATRDRVAGRRAMTSRKVGVLGPGAIGGLIAARLSKAD